MAQNSTRRFEDSKTWARTTITPVMVTTIIMGITMAMITATAIITVIVTVIIMVLAATSTHQPILAGPSRSASRSTPRS